jgi:serpin B
MTMNRKSNRSSFVMLCAALGASAIVGCGTADHRPPAPPEVRSDLSRITNPEVAPADVASLVQGNTAFAAELHQRLAQAGGNLVYSPFSLSEDLAMVRAFASSSEREGIDSTLHFTLPDPKLDRAFDSLDLALTGLTGASEDGNVGHPINVANVLWSAARPQGSGLDTLAQYYGAGILVGGSPGAQIQAWLAAQSAPPLPFQLVGGADFALVNLVTFDAAWETAFDPAATRSGDFHRADGSTTPVDFMHAEASLAVSTGDTPAIEIAYDGGSLSLVVMVPDDLASFEASLTGDQLSQVIARLQPAMVSLALPKFQLTTNLPKVLETLQQMGLPLDSGHWGISHSAKINVSEKGTQAAAVTATSHTPSAVEPSTPFNVDRPFLFLVRDKGTGAIVFQGRIGDPGQSS